MLILGIIFDFGINEKLTVIVRVDYDRVKMELLTTLWDILIK